MKALLHQQLVLATALGLLDILFYCLVFIGLMLFAAGMVRGKHVADTVMKHLCLFAVGVLATVSLGHWLTHWQWLSSHRATTMTPVSLAWYHHSLSRVAADPFHYLQQLLLMMAGVLPLALVAGITAERLRFWALMAFGILMVAVIEPVLRLTLAPGGAFAGLHFMQQSELPMLLYAGALAGGCGCALLGPRYGKYQTLYPTLKGHHLILASLGVLLAILGVLIINSIHPTTVISQQGVERVLMNASNLLLAISVGTLVAVVMCRLWFGNVDLTLILNALLASAAAMLVDGGALTVWQVVLVAGGAALLAVVGIVLFDHRKLDDPMGGVASFGLAIAWSWLWAPVLTAAPGASWGNALAQQALGVLLITTWVVLASVFAWFLIRFVFGLRVNPRAEAIGLDFAFGGGTAYPEFTHSGKS